MQVIDVTPTNEVEKAGWIGRRLHPFDAFDAGSVIPTGFAAYARIDHPREGVMPPKLADALARLLSEDTVAETALWLAIWDGYGEMNGPPAIMELTAHAPGKAPTRSTAPLRGFIHPPLRPRHAPRLKLPNRDYLLYRGRPDQVAGWMDGPNLWWPDDRSWCVASEIDLPWTYLGGSSQMVAKVLASEALSARPVSLDESTVAELDERP